MTAPAHFPAILAFVYRNRFAVASQIERRFTDRLRSDRTTRRHLEELEGLGLLALAPTRGVSPLFPKVYYVTGRGVRKLREALAAKGKPWNAVRVDRAGRLAHEGYSADRVLHEILITEFLLSVRQTIVNRPDIELLTIQRRSLTKHPAFRVTIAGRNTKLIPDALFLFRHSTAGMICSLVELDMGTMNAKQIGSKYRRYAAWMASDAGLQYLIDLYRTHGAKNPRPSFRLLMLAQGRPGTDDEQRMRELCAPVSDLPPTLRNRLWFTTVTELRRYQHDPDPLAAAIWVRGRDFGQSADRYHVRDSSQERGRRLAVFDVDSLPRYELFP